MDDGASMILINGKVAQVNAEFSFAEAVAIKDNRIIAVGTNEEIQKLQRANTRVIDVRGNVILPGGFDSHMHAAFTGFLHSTDILDFSDKTLSSVEDLLSILRKRVQEIPEGNWIIGNGLDISQMREYIQGEISEITRWNLDMVTPGHPVCIIEFGAHALVMNSMALDMAGITADIPDVPEYSGCIGRKDGQLTGVFTDWAAQSIAGKGMFHLSDRQIETSIQTIQEELLSHGITFHTDVLGIGGNEIGWGSWGEAVINAYERLEEEGRLKSRVGIQVYPAVNGIQNEQTIREGMERMKLSDFQKEGKIQARTVKLFGDSSAWMRNSTEGRSAFPGYTWKEQKKALKDTVEYLHNNNWQVGIHAIGGSMIDMAVEVFSEIEEENPGKDLRHFIIHGDQISKENIEKMRKYHILLSPQPIAAGYMLDAFGDDEMFRFQDYMDHDIIVAGGSDADVFSINWLEGLQIAMTRKTFAGNVYNREYACSIEDGIRMYTINGAIQNHVEKELGSIETGKLADLQILNQDIFEIPAEEIGKTEVIMTICNGEVVWQR